MLASSHTQADSVDAPKGLASQPNVRVLLPERGMTALRLPPFSIFDSSSW